MQASKLEAADGNLGEAERCEDEHGPSQGGSDWGELDQTMKNKVSGAIQTILAVMLIWMRTTLQPLQPGTSVGISCTERTACRYARAARKQEPTSKHPHKQ